ncbi:uncharacterized protein LOC111071680 isoform X1 [Drosophila obscura]|uniref:uncharacterized protein LOC111071680 isoform X1 n=1 Tax=Drosophila obscura TaxID=7282 RepID=UPI001BB17882|nr:uncharacterized protein LOC111071680 isoform X1 [Drosophila obscura]
MNLQKFGISFLNEFCVKTNWPTPQYDVMPKSDGFLCQLKLKDVHATGEGSSKNIARQVAALRMWKKILKIPVIRAILEQADASAMMPTTSRGPLFGEIHLLTIKQRKKLRELLLLVANNITSDPEFSIPKPIPKPNPKPIAKPNPKPNPKPIAKHIPKPIFKTIPQKLPALTLESAGCLIELPYPDDDPVERTPSFECNSEKTNGSSHNYEPRHRYTKPGCGPSSNFMKIKMSDHNYFKNFPTELKVAAFKVINSKDFKTKKDQAVALLAALKLTYTMDLVPCKDPRDPLVKVELHCDYNGLFIDFKRNIYNYIIDYLRDMLD